MKRISTFCDEIVSRGLSRTRPAPGKSIIDLDDNMPSFFITTTACDTPWYPWAHSNFLRVLHAANISMGDGNSMADHPRDADIIMFVEAGYTFQSDITLSPLYRAYAEKSVVLDFQDNPFPVLPGLYVGLNQRQSEDKRFKSGFYIRVAGNRCFKTFEAQSPCPDILFSFVGCADSCPALRGRILDLNHPRAIVQKQSSKQSDNDANYLETIYRSQFVLAPRGFGPSSWRLFETMRAGRVPVIVSDDWVPPEGIAWNNISVRIPEREVEKIPEILESLESRSEHMGIQARREWERCFSFSHGFRWIASRVSECIAASQGCKPDSRHLLRRAFVAGQGFQFLKERLTVRFRV